MGVMLTLTKQPKDLYKSGQAGAEKEYEHDLAQSNIGPGDEVSWVDDSGKLKTWKIIGEVRR